MGSVKDTEEIPVAGAHIAFIYERDTLQVFDAKTDSDGGYTVLLSPISPTAVEETRESGIPRTFQLFQNYPNPFNPTTVIEYALPEPGYVELLIYNVLGHRICTLVDRYQEAGGYAVEWDGRDARGMGVSAGVYLYRLKAGAYETSGKMAMVDGVANKEVVLGVSRSHKSVALGQEELDSYTIRITGEDIENFQQTGLVIPADDLNLFGTRLLDFTVSRRSAIEYDLDEENEPVEIATDGDPSIAAYLIDPVTNRQSPGLFAAIINQQGGSSIASAGVRKQGRAEPVSVNDLIHIGSCTKAMTATMLATLVADGTFQNGWQTTIAEVFPEIVSSIHGEYADVSLWELLDHTSGIAGNAQNWWVHRDMDIVERRYTILSENLIEAPAGVRGEYLYSNLAYMVAGAMAERLTGESWETLMQRRIFTPLGMSSAGFGAPGSIGEVDQPWGHRQEDDSTEWVAKQFDNAAALGPAGTVHASIEDWTKFIQLFFADTTPGILDRRKLDELVTPRKENYAAGWYVVNRGWASGKAYNHNGSNTMWYVTLWIAPELNHAFIAAANSANSDSRMLLDGIISNLINHADPGEE